MPIFLWCSCQQKGMQDTKCYLTQHGLNKSLCPTCHLQQVSLWYQWVSWWYCVFCPYHLMFTWRLHFPGSVSHVLEVWIPVLAGFSVLNFFHIYLYLVLEAVATTCICNLFLGFFFCSFKKVTFYC